MADKTMRFDITAVDKASTVFAKVGLSVDKLAKQLDDLSRKEAKPKVTLDSEAARNRLRDLDAALRALSNQRVRVDLDLGSAKSDVGDLRRELSYLRDTRFKVQMQAGSTLTELTAITRKLAALRDANISVDVDGTEGALRKVNALVTEMRKLRNARIRVDIEGDGAAKIAALAASLRTLGREVRLKVKLDDGTFTRDIARLHQRVSALRGTTVRIDFDLRPPGIQAELESIAASLRALRGTTTHRVDVDTTGARRSLTDTILSFKLLGAAAASPIAIPGVFAATSSLLSLGGAAVSASGSLALLPAAGAAAGAAMATLGLGLSHVADALGPRDTAAQIKKVEKALAALSPAAREAVDTIRGLGPAFSEMRLAVQEKLFAGMAEEIDSVSRVYLPVLKAGLGGVAEELNVGAKIFTAWVSEGKTIADVNTILGNTRTTMRELAPAGTNVAAALTDMAVVGSKIMPELAAGATAATERFREFIAEARRSGELEQWIRGGLDTLAQLGQVAKNTGGILGGMFRASEAAGADFLGSTVRITGALDDLVNSAQGQERLVTVFRESQASVDAMLPGVQALATGVLDLLANFSTTQGLQEFGALISRTAIAVEPLLGMLGTLAGQTLGALAAGATIAVGALTPIVGAITGITGALGPVVPLALAAVIAFKGLGLIAPSIVALGTAMQVGAVSAAIWAGSLTGSAAIAGAAGSAALGLGTAVGALGRALPIVGVAAVALGFALQGMSTSTSDAVTALNAGGVAADQMRRALEAQTGVQQAGRSGFDDWANSINVWVNSNVLGIASVETATAAQARQREGMTGLQRAQQDLTAAQANYQAALDANIGSSPAVVAAAGELAAAADRVELEQIAARNATDLHTAAMIQQGDQANIALNASRGYEGALLNLEAAQLRAAEATRIHGADSLEARTANFALEGQLFATAEAAGERARADAVASGASNADQIALRAQKDELQRLANTLTGPARDAVLAHIAELDRSALASGNAETRARLQKDELGRLASMASGQTRSAILGLRDDFDTLGGASATAEQRARLQKDELIRLAKASDGPLRDSFLRLAEQISGMPSGSFTITANGRLGTMFNADGSFKGSAGRFAAGGVMPGYTPGRDVHSFASPTGGRLELSGGEAVMRPEWTRAVGPRWVHGANKAARSGGVGAVSDFIRSNSPAVDPGPGDYSVGGITPTRYAGPVQRLAFGGLVRTGPAYSALASMDHRGTAEGAAARMAPVLAAAIRRYEAGAQAAAAALAQQGVGGAPSRTPGGSNFGGVRPHVAAAGHEILRLFGRMPGGIGGVGARANASDHPKGLALDFMTLSNVALGNRVSQHFMSNFGRLATKYVIWRQRINSGSGWRGMENRGSPTANHMDHPHVSFLARAQGGVIPDSFRPTPAGVFDDGGLLRHGQAALNLSGQTERVLNPAETRTYDRGATPGGQVMVQLGPVVAAVMALGRDLRTLRRDVQISNTFVGADNEAMADRVAQVQRTQASMGMFG